ncbi:MFS multidrug transporter, putative [Talaromyces stipitatus ATCC 10500]|uniref:MFS multidrug transporter, putative n=1 Tax=Talaromyces stipitatus (strain ATCC 10500 / CBS 375.48 / QM 6759 / NRRL 1006) TaxID=441959 RepID=B8LTR1_TALSN|nr:MFS multidrug transporter, putative [Talaromyces stipitatus ATCC 10500]EED23653.1 MFS multidrug transporter, putative [Talaromyces stipitatus ATCC 10500]
MDIVDQDLEKAEIDARHPSQATEAQDGLNLSPSRTLSSLASISSSSSSEGADEPRMERIQTSYTLERHPTALSRIATQRSQHSGTVGASLRSRASKKPLPPFGAGKPYPPPLPAKEAYVVEFDGPDDPLHPMNWPTKKKVLTSVMLAYTTLVSTFGSSIFSSATTTIASVYHVNSEVTLLGLSLYVLGFATGPVCWAPLSELRGRKLPIMIGMTGLTIFEFGVATGKDLQTVLICRFFAGFFGACPIAVVAAVFSDMFDNRFRGVAITVFSITVFMGPLVAPFIGGFIVDSYLGWRWTQYLVGIMAAAALVLDVFFLDETYPPVVLIEKAAELRRRTRNWGIHAKQEEIEVDFRELVSKNFSRPIRILISEPIVLLLSIYMAFVYGLLYLFMTAYPIVFQQIHGFNKGVGGLPYFGMIVGEMIAGIFIICQVPAYNKKLEANNNIPIPEWRLPPAIIGGFSFAAGLFWFGWSGYKESIHWIVPTLSGLLTGFGLLSIFLQCLNYLVDAYLLFAASAIAANTFLRSLAGAGFPLFGSYMFKGMGVEWAGTLLGCVAAVLVPIPVFFYMQGHKIRAKSKFAPTFAPERPADEDEQ